MERVHKIAAGRPIYVIQDTMNDKLLNILEVDFGNAQ